MLPEQRLNLNKFYEWVITREETFHSQVSYGRSGRHWFATSLRKLTSITINGPEKWVEDDPFKINYYHDHRGLVEYAKNLKTVLLIRDPRDCLLSELYHHVYLWNRGKALEWSTEEIFMEQMQPGKPLLKGKVDRWLWYFDHFLPHDTIVIQYERLCLYPEEVMTRVCDFLGLETKKNPVEVIESADNTRARVDKDGIVFESRDYKTGKERYADHCLKWQRDTKMNYLHEHMWEKMGSVMLQWGYIKNGHATNLLTK